MSLYLQIAVGAGRYLLDASHVVEIRHVVETRTDRGAGGDAILWQGDSVAIVDLREMFAEPKDAPGACVLFAQATGDIAALLVDRVDGLIELDDVDDLSPLPPIGPLGTLIDAISTRFGAEHPALRLRGERALAVFA